MMGGMLSNYCCEAAMSRMSGFYAGPPRGCPAPRRPSPTRPSNTAHPPPARPHYRTSSHRFSSHPYRPQSSRHSSLPRNDNRGYYGGERARNNLARNNKGPGHFNNNNNNRPGHFNNNNNNSPISIFYWGSFQNAHIWTRLGTRTKKRRNMQNKNLKKQKKNHTWGQNFMRVI